MILDHGFWAGLTLYPQTKVSPQRAVDMIEKYGPERICVAGACDWGPSDPIAVPEVRDGDAPPPASRGAHPARRASRTRSAFLSQSPKFTRAGRRRGPRARRASADGSRRLCRSIADGSLHLTYCTNIHPPTAGRRSTPTCGGIAPALKARLSPSRRSASACGCRRATRASCSTAIASTSSARSSTREGLYVAHHQRLPVRAVPRHAGQGGRLRARLARRRRGCDYTLDLIEILARARCPTGVDGGVSTAPLSYKPWMHDGDAGRLGRRSTRNVVRVAETLVRLRRRDGHVHPPRHRAGARLPASRTPTRRIAFFERWLLPDGGAAARRGARLSRDEARARTCAITSASASTAATSRSSTRIRAAALERLQRAGIRIGRVQLSSALRVRCRPIARAARGVAERLRPFADSTYLHQVDRAQRRRARALSRSRRRARATAAPAGDRVADSLSRAAVHARVRRPRLDAGLRRARARRGARRRRSRATSRSRPTRGTCCPAALKIDLARVDRAASTSGCWRAFSALAPNRSPD